MESVTPKMYMCPEPGCGQPLAVLSAEPDPDVASSMVLKATCPRCCRRFTVEATTIIRIREGHGPHHDVPPEGVIL